MFGWIVTAAAAGGWLVYQWFTNQPNRGLPPAASRSRASPLPVASELAPLPTTRTALDFQLLERMRQCGATGEDMRQADQWSAYYLGDAMPLRQRLALMVNIVPQMAWPSGVRRAWCAVA